MMCLLKTGLILGLFMLVVGCGQTGPLYIPSQQVAQELGL